MDLTTTPFDAGSIAYNRAAVTVDDVPIGGVEREQFRHLLDKLAGVALPTPAGWRLLVLQYIRPAASKGGIIFADQTKAEDKWQGRVGLVLRVGPGCWADPTRYPEGAWAVPGDIVMWGKLDSAATRFPYGEGVELIALNDDAVVMVGLDALKAVGN